jgi:DNA polymerase-3 subunit alpha
MMAALVEDVRWRTSARGRRYAMATLSDSSGQFVGTCFDDLVSAGLEEAARTGDCALLTVELDRRAGEELPRVTVKRVQPFEALAGHTRLKGEIRLSRTEMLDVLSAELAGALGGRGELILTVPVEGGVARLRLGRTFTLDAELVARLQHLPGVDSFTLSAADPPRLALVS